MDTTVRELERQAAQGDEQARLRLYQTYERMESLGGLQRLTDEMNRVISNGKFALVAAMQHIVANYPVNGFVHETTFSYQLPNVYFVASIKDETFPSLMENASWFNDYWFIGPDDYGDEFDVDNIPEYIGMYGKSDSEIEKHFVATYGKDGALFWATITVLSRFRKLFHQYDVHTLATMMGGNYSWACNADDIYLNDPDRSDAMQAIYRGLSLERYREKRAQELQLRQQLDAQVEKRQEQQQQLMKLLEGLSDEQRRDLLNMYGDKLA